MTDQKLNSAAFLPESAGSEVFNSLPRPQSALSLLISALPLSLLSLFFPPSWFIISA